LKRWKTLKIDIKHTAENATSVSVAVKFGKICAEQIEIVTWCGVQQCADNR